MLLAWLRRNFHVDDFAVTICSKKLEKLCGETIFGTCEFKINIHRQQCFTLRVDSLIHEWAHALTWFGAETHNEDHSAEWGIQYAKIYRTFYEWNWGREHKE